MKKEAAIIRHPHYPEIIKFKLNSLRTTSTLSTSGWDEDLNMSEKMSQMGDGVQVNHDNMSCMGECCGCGKSGTIGQMGQVEQSDKSEYELEDHQMMFDDECMSIHSNV
jgi:hypothetical protein